MASSILITGCPRSGTAYAAQVFKRHGLKLEHEQEGEHGTVDWRLAATRTQHELVLHQVRHPLAVIGSMATIQYAESWAVFEQVMPLPLPMLERCCHAWLMWTAIADRAAELTYRVEDIGEVWPLLRGRGCNLLDFEEKVPHTVNKRAHAEVTWDEVHLAGYGAAIRKRARAYGYEA